MKGITSVQGDLRKAILAPIRERKRRSQLSYLLHPERIPPRPVCRPGELC